MTLAPHRPTDLDEDGDEDCEPWEIAAGLVSYQLSYRRSPTRRVFDRYQLTGGAVDDARRPREQVSGAHWDFSTPTDLPWSDVHATETDWLGKYVRAALQEVVHEALEWLLVAGRVWLDPHRHQVEDLIRDAVTDLHADLCEIVGPLPARPPLAHPGGEAGVEPWQAAAARISFQLSYRRSPQRRAFCRGLLTGPDLDDAHGCGRLILGLYRDPLDLDPAEHHDDDHNNVGAAVVGRRSVILGDYDDGDPDHRATAAEWARKYRGMALREALHEALEWLIVDGRPWCDPHGDHEHAINTAVTRFIGVLHTLHRYGCAQDPA